MWERVSQDEEENGVQVQDSVWAMREGMTARSLYGCLLSPTVEYQKQGGRI